MNTINNECMLSAELIMWNRVMKLCIPLADYRI